MVLVDMISHIQKNYLYPASDASVGEFFRLNSMKIKKFFLKIHMWVGLTIGVLFFCYSLYRCNIHLGTRIKQNYLQAKN